MLQHDKNEDDDVAAGNNPEISGTLIVPGAVTFQNTEVMTKVRECCCSREGITYEVTIIFRCRLLVLWVRLRILSTRRHF